MENEAVGSAETRRDALVERLFNATVGALEMFSIHLGRELDLYPTIAAAGSHGLTYEQLATRCGIAPRYAREWLEQQAVAGFLTVAQDEPEPAQRRFTLPAGHEQALIDADSPAHVSPFADMVAGVGKVIGHVAEAYRSGGGVPYADYGTVFCRGQGGINRPVFNQELLEWLQAVPQLSERLAHGGQVADIGCGEGWSTTALARHFPAARVVGVDNDASSIDTARQQAEREGLLGHRVSFELCDAADLDGPFDMILIFEALHDFSRPVEALAGMRKALAPGGYLLVVDERVAENFNAPGDEVERIMYGWSVTHCLPASLAEEGSAGLGTVLRPGTVAQLATEAGFETCTEIPVSNEFFRLYHLSA